MVKMKKNSENCCKRVTVGLRLDKGRIKMPRVSPIPNLLRLQPALRRGRKADRLGVMMLVLLASVLLVSVLIGVYRMVSA
jgi:hypothetical protein